MDSKKTDYVTTDFEVPGQPRLCVFLGARSDAQNRARGVVVAEGCGADVVSGAGLSIYAEVALVIFLIAFLGIVISLFAPGKRRTYEHLRRLPIDEGHTGLPLHRDSEDPSLRSG